MSNVGNSNSSFYTTIYKTSNNSNDVKIPLKNNIELKELSENKSQIKLNNTVLGNAISSLSFNDDSNNFIEYKIKRGDSLSDISKEYLGSSNKYMEIFEANRDKMRNPNDLVIGMTIKIPANNITDKIINPKVKNVELKNLEGFKEITVGKGQSLSSISLKHLGNSERYMEIFESNKDILKTPDSLRAGMKLKIPVYVHSEQRKTPITQKTNTSIINNPIIGEMTTGALNIYNTLKNYQDHHEEAGNVKRTKTTDAEMKEIAVELDKASKAFGVDPKVMLAVYAHESGGFNPRARSHTGAGGLGQLTSIAIRQVHYMAGMSKGQKGIEPYINHRENFIQSQTNLSQRYNIKKNIWTSTAYMAYEINERSNGNIKKALEKYGDPNVSTYENKVNKEYKLMFGKSLF